MNIDSLALRDALGQYATGVAIVTALDGAGQPAGLTVNSFASVSLEPPLVLWSLARTASCMPAFEGCSHFVVNVLAAEQRMLADRFATTGIDRFAGVAWTPGIGGAPLLADCCATFECRSETWHEGGDHLIFVGRVERFARADLPPLLFHSGRYCARGEFL